jgi:hypothetical protein
MKKIYYYLLALSICFLPLLGACKHQKCPTYMTKEEIEATHKKHQGSAKKRKSKPKNVFGN